MDRRSFVHTLGGIVVLGLAQACVPAAPVARPAQSGGTVQMPTYVPFKGPEPDLPGTTAGVQPAYFSYPKNPPRIYPQPLLKGSDVSGIVSTPTPPPPPIDQNLTWQEVNRQLGVPAGILW